MNLPIPISIIPKRKLNVFVSSACGDEKERYNEVRQQIKNCICKQEKRLIPIE